MTDELVPGLIVDALSLTLEHRPLPAEQVISGSPTTGMRLLDHRYGRQLGVWEMTPGVAIDVEEDEVFVVLSGRATLEGASPQTQHLTSGCLVRLTSGMRTTWSVHETLRKLFIA